jgi:tryptophan synthase beta chain
VTSQAPERGHFGPYGGRFVPEALTAALDGLDAQFREALADPAFHAELDTLHHTYTGRPSPLTEAVRFGQEHCGGARVFLKREDLNHTGSHKINNVLGQALLTVHMGEEDTRRQALKVVRMRLLGATVVPVTAGSRTLKDAINEAMRDWVTTVDETHYILGTVTGPSPFPEMVRYFQSVIGREARQQVLDAAGRLPDAVAACVGGGSNAMGLFSGFIDDPGVALWGFEAGGDGVETGRHAARFAGGSPGVLHGARTYVMQDEWGQTMPSHSISAGLDYPGVGPEHAWLHDTGRAHYAPVTDAEAMDAFQRLCRTEGIIPAIETAHALAGAMRLGHDLGPEAVIVVNLSGRGDKDVATAARWFGLDPVDEAAEGR